MAGKTKLIPIFAAIYGLLLVADWGARLVPFHFGYHAAHFYMLDQVGRKTRYYRADAEFDQPIHGYLSSLIGIEKYKYYHHQRIRTNSLGLRVSDPPDTGGKWPIYVIGDSFMFGSYNSDEHTLCARLGERLDMPVRNLSFPGNPTLNMVDVLRNYHPLPPVIIWGITERAITLKRLAIVDSLDNEELLKWEQPDQPAAGFNLFKEWFEYYSKDSLVRYGAETVWSYCKYGLLNNIDDVHLWIPLNPEMLFYREGINLMGREADADILQTISDKIGCLVQRANQGGARVILLLIPDKCSVYPEYVGSPELSTRLTQNRFLDHVAKKLRSDGHYVVNLWPLLEKNKSRGYMYYPDDTHWTPLAIDIAAEALHDYIEQVGILGEK
jgi:hypothetical protein